MTAGTVQTSLNELQHGHSTRKIRANRPSTNGGYQRGGLMAKTVRIGIIGAGNFTQRRSIPSFKALPDVEIVAVANRSLASAQAVAKEFDIPWASDDWRALLARDDVDAVLIGSPPYIHRDVAVAAFDAGKDVLTQTRMAKTLDEAREMARKARDTGRKGMVFPPNPYFSLTHYVKHLIQTGYTGTVRQVFAQYMTAEMVDSEKPFGRRSDPVLFSYPNHLGLYWDVLSAWFGDATRVLADARIYTPERTRGADSTRIPAVVPESTTVIAETESGAVVTLTHTDVTRFGQSRIEIYGERGTLVFPSMEEVMGGRGNDKELAPLTVPPEWQGAWQAEEEFVRLVRGEAEVAVPSFEDGLKNMEFLEAARQSSIQGQWVDLPLP